MLKPLTNHRLLKSAFEKGYLDEVAKALNAYQSIESDREWEDDEGCKRKKTFLVKHSKGVARWHVKMCNGCVTGVGCVWEADLSRPIYTA